MNINKTNVFDHVSQSDFHGYVKTAVTQMAHMWASEEEPVTVETMEGEYVMTTPFMLALDASGFPYPVNKEIFEETYILAGEE